MLIKIYLYTALLNILNFNSGECSNTSSQRITIIGIALNDKDGAIVETGKGDYVVDGLDEWDEKYYGKSVKETGKLKVIESKRNDTESGRQKQERVGKLLIIKKPSWELQGNVLD